METGLTLSDETEITRCPIYDATPDEIYAVDDAILKTICGHKPNYETATLDELTLHELTNG